MSDEYVVVFDKDAPDHDGRMVRSKFIKAAIMAVMHVGPGDVLVAPVPQRIMEEGTTPASEPKPVVLTAGMEFTSDAGVTRTMLGCTNVYGKKKVWAVDEDGECDTIGADWIIHNCTASGHPIADVAPVGPAVGGS